MKVICHFFSIKINKDMEVFILILNFYNLLYLEDFVNLHFTFTYSFTDFNLFIYILISSYNLSNIIFTL